MSQLPVPFAQRRTRLPQAGRIRFGEKVFNPRKGKIQPKALDRFRFTAPTRGDLDILAGIYGGQVKPWSEPKSEDRFQLYSDASAIAVILPPEPLGDGPTYEMWGGKGLVRSCDGIACELTTHGPDGAEVGERPCLCRERQRRECEPKLRLAVILPQLSLRGIWRLDTGSDLAADEMPGMVELILGLQQRGLAAAELRLERRQSMGGSHQFVVPALGVPHSFEALAAGEIGPGEGSVTLALPPAPNSSTRGEADDSDVIDAEVVENDGNAGIDYGQDPGGDVVLTTRQKNQILNVARARAAAQGKPLPMRYEDII